MSDLQIDIDAGYFDEPTPRERQEQEGVTPEESERAARDWYSYNSNLHEGRYA